MNHLQMLQLLDQHGKPLPLAAAQQGRVTLDGPQILGRDGNPIVWRGFNNGHGELGNDYDSQLQADAGANFARDIGRKWGTWTGVVTDGDDLTQASGLLPDYLLALRDKVMQNYRAGMGTDLAWDSNCGQTERKKDLTCELGTGTPQTFWTTGGQDRWQDHLTTLRWTARILRGYVDTYEPVVEPHPKNTIPTGELKTDVWSKQEEAMEAILDEDPAAVFTIGPAPSYQAAAVYDWFNPKWVGRFPIIYTCNLLDSGATSPNLPDRIAQLVQLRADYGVPVFVQQVGTTRASDPYDNYLKAVLSQLNEAEGGSIGWTWWEWISPIASAYGPYYGGVSNRNVHADRLALLEQYLTATRTYA